MANSGEFKNQTACWSEIDADSRLRLPTEIATQVSWCVPGQRCDVLLELHEQGAIRIHDGNRNGEIEAKRQTLQNEFENKEEALRRIAASHVIFIPTTIGKTNRRVTLSAQVLSHMGVARLSKVLCLVYADSIEVLSELCARQLFEITRVDVNLSLKLSPDTTH